MAGDLLARSCLSHVIYRCSSNSDWTSHATVDIDVKLNKLLVQSGQLELCRYLLLQWTVFLFLNGLRDC